MKKSYLNNMKFEKLSIKEKLTIYAFSCKLFFKSRKERTYDIINADYDLDAWNQDFEKIDWKTHYKNLTEKVIFGYNGGVFKGKRKEFERAYFMMLSEFFSGFKNESIVELGCGLGVHLFYLYDLGFKKLEGYDLSNNAILRAKQHSKDENISIGFETHDLNKTFRKNEIENKIVFTHACLEQCHLFMSNILKNIIDGNPKMVINFEVDYDSAPTNVKKYFDACGYQNNLVKELRSMEKNGSIEIVSIQKLPLSLSAFNKLSAIIWKIK